MNNPDIGIIINSFNRFELLKQCMGVIDSWLPQSGLLGRLEAIVYDAGSTDGSLEWLNNHANGLAIPYQLITPVTGADTSFSAGINTASEFAIAKFPSLKYLLFYETDNQIFSPEPILRALKILGSKANLGACGFTVRQHNGSPAGVGMPFPRLINFALGKNLVHKWQLEAISYKWENQIDDIKFSEVDVVYTSPLLLKMEAWNDSGGFDAANFPFSDCDIDWARRLRNAGWHMGVIETNEVIHDNLSAVSSWSKSRALQFHRARLKYFKRYQPVAVFLVWPLLLIFRHLLELTSVLILVKGRDRRIQLSGQFSDLLRLCIKGYK